MLQITHTFDTRKVFLFLLTVLLFLLTIIIPILLSMHSVARQQNTSTINYAPALRNEQGALVSPTPVPTPIPAPTYALLSNFAGDWYTHAGDFVMKPDGHATLSLRVYVWCKQNGGKPPCDDVNNHGDIIWGVREEMTFTKVEGVTAYGTIIASTIGNAGKPISATLGPNDTIKVRDRDVFCGPKSPSGLCGA